MMEDCQNLIKELRCFCDSIIPLFHYSNIPKMLGALVSPAGQTVTPMQRAGLASELP